MNIDVTNLKAEYDKRISDFHHLADTVKFILQEEAEKNKIKYHSFTFRIKTFDSLLKKIRIKKSTDPFKDIHDFVGLRIVCLFLPDLELMGNIIKKEFDVFEEDDKVDNQEVDIFGYMSLHYKAKLKIDSLQSVNIGQRIPFEIQVRTIAQDAWAAISHYLDYKQESFLPDHLKRDFHALSGLFYVADTHFSILRQEQLKFFVEKLTGESAQNKK